MRVQNNPSFCGKVIPVASDVVNVGHLLTPKVRGEMSHAPSGSTLSVVEGKFLDRCRVIFTAPEDAFRLVIKGMKRAMSEEHVLNLIKRGAAKIERIESREPVLIAH